MRNLQFRAFISYGHLEPDLVDTDTKDKIYETGLQGFIDTPDLIDFKYQRIKYDSDWYDKDRFELMKFTGMYDKTGKPIYEGDIVEAWSEGIKARGEIKQRIDGLWFINPDWQSGTTWALTPDKDGKTTVLIVGNIYENEGGVIVKKYRKKPIVIEAIQYDKASIGKAQNFCNKMKYNPHNNEYYIETLEGTMLISEGDYIIKGVNGEFYLCKADIFEKTYEEVQNESSIS